MKRLLIATAALSVALCGCSGGDKPAEGGSSTTAKGDAKKKFVIGFSQCTITEPWRVQMNKDIEEAAKAHPDEVELKIKDGQDRSEQQQSDVRELIQQKVDLIIISPKESRPLTKPVAEAYDAGIPVIVLDRKVEGDKYTCYIGGDNVKIGEAAGKYVAELLKGKGNIVELKGNMTSTPAKERHDGFMKGIGNAPGIKFVFEADCDWKEPNAQREMTSALAVNPQIDVVYGHNDPSAHGAYKAAEQEGKGREKSIKFIGIDALPTEGVKYVKDGVLSATFQYPTCGKEAIDTALTILKGGKVEKNITLGTKLFTKENAEAGGKDL
jgi:ribose transport system substrate-binding protein